MSRNGRHTPARPHIEIGQSSATPEEAAAIAAAIEQFLRDTAPPPSAPQPRLNAWMRAGLLEGARYEGAAPSAWGDPERWGS